MRTFIQKYQSILILIGLCYCCTFIYLGSSNYLTYHEAFVAQAAREIGTSGDWIIPTINQTPWLEKPPLPFWTVALLSRVLGGINEWTARAPFAIAGVVLVFVVYSMAKVHFGSRIGLLAGCIQSTTIWFITRGRLAEADIMLVAIITSAMFALDQFRTLIHDDQIQKAKQYQLLFFTLLGLSSLVKGIGFGAVLVLSVATIVLIWDRDVQSAKRLLISPWGWTLFLIIGFSWPIIVLVRNPEALHLWILHIRDRINSRPTEFSGESLYQYSFAYFWQTLPWTPFAILGMWRSRQLLRRDAASKPSIERFLWIWTVVPALLVSCAAARNAHYLLYSYPPWSIWAALSLNRAFERFADRGRRLFITACLLIALICIVYYGLIARKLDHRGKEWKFYQEIHSLIQNRRETVCFLYDDWDRKPYHTPFGSIPHDLGVRLFYLNRPLVIWSDDPFSIDQEPSRKQNTSIFVVARERDLPVLRKLGDVKYLITGAQSRWDRRFLLFEIALRAKTSVSGTIADVPDDSRSIPKLSEAIKSRE